MKQHPRIVFLCCFEIIQIIFKLFQSLLYLNEDNKIYYKHLITNTGSSIQFAWWTRIHDKYSTSQTDRFLKSSKLNTNVSFCYGLLGQQRQTPHPLLYVSHWTQHSGAPYSHTCLCTGIWALKDTGWFPSLSVHKNTHVFTKSNQKNKKYIYTKKLTGMKYSSTNNTWVFDFNKNH
jgi:hypothetical protein